MRYAQLHIPLFVLLTVTLLTSHAASADEPPIRPTSLKAEGNEQNATEAFGEDTEFFSSTETQDESLNGPGRSVLLPELEDAAFNRYVDLGELASAISARDAVLLTDIGLQLADGERILMCSHKSGIRAKHLLQMAAKLAGDKKHKETLDRLTKAADRLKVKGLAEHIATMNTFGESSRTAEQAFTFSLDDLTTEEFAEVKGFRSLIATAELLADRGQLEAIKRRLNTSQYLPKSVRRSLQSEIDKTIASLSDETSDASNALIRLVGTSRAPDDFVVRNMTNNILRIDVVRVSKQFHAVWRMGWVTLKPGERKRFAWKGIEPEARIYLTVRNRDTGKLWTDNEDWTSKRIFVRPAVVYTKRSGAPRGGEYFVRHNSYVAKQVFFGDWKGLKRIQRNLTRYPTSTRISTNNRSWIGVSIKIYGNYRFVGNSWGKD